MVVGIKDARKLIGISVISCCAVLVCEMFTNFYFDILQIKDMVSGEMAAIFYDAQVSTIKVVCFVSGGCLLVTSVIMLFFYIKHYIDIHKKELGILKALGYSDLKIAKHFWIFGVSVFQGTLAGYCGTFLLMPRFYKLQNKDHYLPEITMHIHPSVFVYFVILPAAAFAVLAIAYAAFKIRRPVLQLIREDIRTSYKIRRSPNSKERDCPFLEELRRSTLKSRKTLVFFIMFASFCFSSMTQMSASMKDLASDMMGMMMLAIGIVLACTTLFMAITTVIGGNTKTIAMMRVFGYSKRECQRAILGCYRPMAYIGFAVGTVYQYALLRLMVDVVFEDMEGIPVYEFDFPVMFISLAAFLVIYEVVMYYYSARIKKISMKEIMLE